VASLYTNNHMHKSLVRVENKVDEGKFENFNYSLSSTNGFTLLIFNHSSLFPC
jgi:hypothetical protein